MNRSRAAGTGLVALVLALVAPSCAQGDAIPTAEVTETAPVVGDDAGATATCPPCSAGEMCSGGKCVSVTTDADGDGVPLKNDCNDHDAAIHPGAPEACNGIDDNCDGRIDEGFDVDGDGTPSCAIGTKLADCDDKDPAIFPGAPEVCNGKDDDCNGKVDDGFDKDNDGFYSCMHGTLAVDCDDTNPNIHPGATEICNAKDDDCNGKTDENPAILTGSLVAPINPHWALAGAASISAGWARLTADGSPLYQAGALWWNAPYTFDTFDVSATFWIQNKADGADGLAFAWVPGNNVTTAGASGAGLGFGGLGGYAVAIDTFSNTGEPAVPFLAIMQGATVPTTLARATIPNVRDALNHKLRVRLSGGKVSIWLDTINYIFEFPLPSYAPFSGHWGFTAATGGASEAHWVNDVSMSFPEGQGCVP